jgi:hypothetical protein
MTATTKRIVLWARKKQVEGRERNTTTQTRGSTNIVLSLLFSFCFPLRADWTKNATLIAF